MTKNIRKELKRKLLNSVLSKLIEMCKSAKDNKVPMTTFCRIESYFNAGVHLGIVEKKDFDELYDSARLAVFGETNAGRKERLTYERISQKKREIAQLEASLR